MQGPNCCEVRSAGVLGVLQAVKVNSLGKWKTALQMTSMSVLLFCKDVTGRVEHMFTGEDVHRVV
jgi:phosphatidylglycerophosphate synthase